MATGANFKYFFSWRRWQAASRSPKALLRGASNGWLMNSNDAEFRNDAKTSFPIIGIGASAGGLVPFQKMLEALPSDFGAAVVFIQHLLADKKSLLPEILRKQFPSRDIIAIMTGMTIEKGKVYVNQPDQDITMESGRFHVTLRQKDGVHLPIDTFFCSLAETAQDNAIAVVLSGAGTDGSRGVREVQCKGGAVLVQDPDTAEVTGMPHSAIEAGAIDEVLTPESIALRLVALVGAISKRPDAAQLENQPSLQLLSEFLREKAGFRFNEYKKTVVARRVQRRMSLNALTDIIEELKSSNEELQSSNEELEAANEEMETSREELQSINEELITVNAQLQSKIEEEEATNNDLNNFLSSTNIPTLFLDHQLNVRRFTPSITKLIKLIPSDIGRPIADMGLERLGAGLLADIRTALDGPATVKNEIALGDAWYLRSAFPFRASDNRIEGVVITYVDSTELTLSDANLKEEREKFKAIFENSNDAIVLLDFTTGRYIDCNRMLRTITGYTLEEVCAMSAGGLMSTPHTNGAASNLAKIRANGTFRGETELISKHGALIPVDYSAFLLTIGSKKCLVSVIRDISERKQTEREIQSLAKFPAENPNPIVRMSNEGLVLYFNRACEPLMHKWNAAVGKTVPEDICAIVSETLAGGSPKTFEVDYNGRIYSCDIVPVPEAGYVNLYGRDITERRRVEEALSESRQRNEFLADIIESSSQPFGVGYMDGRLGLFNKAFERLTGYSVEELHSIDWATMLTPPEYKEMEANKLQELHKTGLPVCYQKEYLRKDGSRVPIELLVHLKKDEAGKPLYFYSFITDITERRKAEDALRESEERARARAEEVQRIMEVAPIAIWVANDPHCHDIVGNREANRFYEAEEGENVSAGPAAGVVDRARRFFHAGRELMPEELPMQEAAAKGIDVLDSELEVLLPSGRTMTMIGQASPLRDAEGNVRGCVGAFLDITKRKKFERALYESEEKYRTLFETMAEGFSLDEIILDDKGKPVDLRYLMVNPAFERQTGLKAADVVGKTTLELFPHAEPVWFEFYGKVVLTGEPARLEEKFGPLERWFNVNAFPAGGSRFAVVFTDITDLKKMEEEQQIILQRFYLILSNLHFGIVLVTDENRIEFANQAFCDMFSLKDSPEDLLELSADEMIEKIKPAYRDPETSIVRINEIVSLGKPVRGEDVEMRSERAFLRDYIPIRINEKKYGRLWVHVEITEIKRVERALRESEEKYRNLFNTMDEGFCIIEMLFDEQGKPSDYRFLEVNAAFEKQTGLHEAQGKLMRDLAPAHEAHWFEIYGKIALTGESVHFSNEARALDRYYDVYAYRVGRPEDRHVAIIFNDVSEIKRAELALRESEQRLKFHLENSPLAVVEWDADYFVTQWSIEAERIFGWKKEEVLGKRIDTLNMIYPDDIPIVTRTMERLSGGKEVTVVSSNRNYTKSGGIIECMWYNSVLLDENKRMKSVMSLVEDITERKAAEQALHNSNALLKERNSELDSFSYSVSHDLKGPLRAICGFNKLLEREYAVKLDKEGKQYIDFIAKAGDRMSQIIEDLLSLSRISRAEIKQTDINLGAVARTLAADLKQSAPERKVEFVIDDIIVQADPALMRHVIENLIYNAWKFTSKCENARIEFASLHDGGKTVCFMRDNGAGFDMAQSHKLFTPFHRLHSASDFPGTGIGLAIVKRVVERHGGKVWAEGEVGKGATIYFEMSATIDK